MPYSSLRDFIDRLEQGGGLARVKAPVSPVLEMTEIQTRLLAERGPAVLFENVADAGRDYAMPVLVNLFGTVERVALGMDREPAQLREIGHTLAFLRQPEPPGGWREAFELLPLLRTVMAMRPRTVAAAPCQEIVLRGAEIDLGILPVQTCWPGEPAPLITWPLVVTKGPGERREDGFNLGIYRMQVTGRDTTLMRWLAHRGGAQHHRRWAAARQEPLPAAAVIGADPGTILAAVTPVPDTLSEYQFAGLLRGRRVELVDCKTVPLKVPAQAEIVLEVHVALDELGDPGRSYLPVSGLRQQACYRVPVKTATAAIRSSARGSRLNLRRLSRHRLETRNPFKRQALRKPAKAMSQFAPLPTLPEGGSNRRVGQKRPFNGKKIKIFRTRRARCRRKMEMSRFMQRRNRSQKEG
jgi:4-hydroxy-3-polyprenylbenzoate decarboxylase